MFRLLASYMTSRLNKMSSNDNNENSPKRQIFITLSDKLCRKVKDYFNKLRVSAEIANHGFHEFVGDNDNESNDKKLVEDDDIMNDIPNSFRELTDEHFPLII